MADIKKTKFICDFCGCEEKSKKYLERHLDKKHHKFTCNVCDQVYKSKSNLIEHLRAHFQKFICQYCGEEVNSFKKLQKHIYLKHEPHNKDLILSVQSKVSYNCRHCVRNFPTAVHRNSHETNVHKDREEAAFKCNVCNLIFITKEQLRSHSFEHYAGTLHFCAHPDCDRFFKTVRQLRAHEKIHAPAKYKCDKCDQKFFQSSNHSKHKKRCKGKAKDPQKIVSKDEEETAKAQLLSLGEKLMKDEKSNKKKKMVVEGKERKRKSAVNKASVEKILVTKSKIPQKQKTRVSEDPKIDKIPEIVIETPRKNVKIDENSDHETKTFANRLPTTSTAVVSSLSSPPPTFTSIFIKESPLKDRHICQVCGFQTSLHAELRHHLKNHQLEKSLTCHLCTTKFTKKTELNRHLLSTHKVSKRRNRKVSQFSCDFCGTKIVRISDLIRHLKQHVKPKEECSMCDAKLRNLPKHMKEVHTTDRPFVCTICGAGFKARNNLNSHLKTHDEPSECPICKKFLPNMQRHLLWHQKPKPAPFQCPQCLRNCATKQAVQEHIHRVHEKVPLGKCYTCTICNLNFIRNRDLRRHSYIHYKGKIFSCIVLGCHEMFKKSFKLQSHMMVHNASNEASFHCEYCDKKYLRKTALSKHMKAAHPEVKTTETVSIKIVKKVYD